MENASEETLETMRHKISILFDHYAKERAQFGGKYIDLFCYLLSTYQFRLLEKELGKFADANRGRTMELQEKILEIVNEKENKDN